MSTTESLTSLTSVSHALTTESKSSDLFSITSDVTPELSILTDNLTSSDSSPFLEETSDTEGQNSYNGALPSSVEVKSEKSVEFLPGKHKHGVMKLRNIFHNDGGDTDNQDDDPQKHLNVRAFLKNQTSLLYPKVQILANKIQRRKNESALRLKPHIHNARIRRDHVIKTFREHGTKAGVSIALRGVRLMTGLPTAFPATEFADDLSDEELDDPANFDLKELDHYPVEIPKLVIKVNPQDSRGDQLHSYFVDSKNLRYDAIIDQAASKYTKTLAEKFRKGEIKPPIKELAATIGPRVHVGFKCDADKQLLTIRIIEASGLPGLDSNGLSDPFCVATLKPDADITPLRTRTIGKTINPKWKEVFELSGVPPIGVLQKQTLHIKVFDYDQLGKDDLMGFVDISFGKHDLIGGTDTWFDLRTPQSEDQFKNRGNVLIGLRYDEKQEKLSVLIERCQSLEKIGMFLLKCCLHINGKSIKMKELMKEQIVSVHPELKQRVTFKMVRKSLLNEYIVTVYMGFRKYNLWNKYFGQVNLSSRSKNKEEQAIWAEVTKMAGDTIFKVVPIQKFSGLIRKPWKPDDAFLQRLGFLNVTLKTSDTTAGMTFSCGLEAAEELKLPQRTTVWFDVYLVKDSIELSKLETGSKTSGERITPIEEKLDFHVRMKDVKFVSLVIVAYTRKCLGKKAFGQVCLSTKHVKSTVDEMELWQTVLKTTGNDVTRRLELRPLIPEIVPYYWANSKEITLLFKNISLLPGKEPSGALVFRVKYDEKQEVLTLLMEQFKNIRVLGRVCILGFFCNLTRSRRNFCKSTKLDVQDANQDFQQSLKFEHVHVTMFQSYYLYVQLKKVGVLWCNKTIGQIVLKLE